MSLCVGPIHKILFGKIKFQEDLYNFLIARAMDQNPDSQLDEYIFENCQHLPAGELEDVVDTTNIHGSLQSMIVIVEKKLAFTVNEIVKHNLLPWAEIVRLSGRYGELNAFPPNTSLEEAYPLIAGKILNGMPCDRVEEIVDKSDDRILWKDRIDIHGQYWTDLGLDVDKFYEIRTSVIKGLLSETRLEYTSPEKFTFELKKK